MLLGAGDPLLVLALPVDGEVAAAGTGAATAGADAVPAAVSVFSVAAGVEDDSPAGGFILSE